MSDVRYPAVSDGASPFSADREEGKSSTRCRSNRYLRFGPLLSRTRRVFTTSAASVDVECPARFRSVLSAASLLSPGPLEWNCVAYIASRSFPISSTRSGNTPRCSRNAASSAQAQRRSSAVFALTPNAVMTLSICSLLEGRGPGLEVDIESVLFLFDM